MMCRMHAPWRWVALAAVCSLTIFTGCNSVWPGMGWLAWNQGPTPPSTTPPDEAMSERLAAAGQGAVIEAPPASYPDTNQAPVTPQVADARGYDPAAPTAPDPGGYVTGGYPVHSGGDLTQSGQYSMTPRQPAPAQMDPLNEPLAGARDAFGPQPGVAPAAGPQPPERMASRSPYGPFSAPDAAAPGLGGNAGASESNDPYNGPTGSTLHPENSGFVPEPFTGPDSLATGSPAAAAPSSPTQPTPRGDSHYRPGSATDYAPGGVMPASHQGGLTQPDFHR